MDETIKPGDCITAYHKGFHIVTRIDKRGKDANYSPMIYYIKILDSNYKPCKHIRQMCDMAWCKKIRVKDLEKLLVNNPAFKEGIEGLIENIKDWKEVYKNR